MPDLPRIGRKESKLPTYAGLDAGARGFADQTTRDADALLVWYRTGGREQAQAVGLYLARRAIAANWHCLASQAHAVILAAMDHVATRRPKAIANRLHMRKDEFLELRALASAWLRAGIMEAEYRYGVACCEHGESMLQARERAGLQAVHYPGRPHAILRKTARAQSSSTSHADAYADASAPLSEAA